MNLIDIKDILMNNLQKIFKTLKKFTILEKIVFILLIILSGLFISNLISGKEGFENSNINRGLIKKSGTEVFDDDYVNIYDDLVYDDAAKNYTVAKIIDTKVKGTKQKGTNSKGAKSKDTNSKDTNSKDTNSKGIKPKLLDIGCGTGHLVNSLNKKDLLSVGIDKSESMIKKAKENYPDREFRTCDVLSTMEFPKNTFTHITCLHYTIYYIKDKRQFFENCLTWLVPNGVLILHLVDMKLLNPILPTLKFNTNAKSTVNSNTLSQNVINFDTLSYKSNFKIDESIDPDTVSLDKPNGNYKEVLKYNNSNKKQINENKLYMSTQRSILSAAKDAGFTLEKQDDMSKIQHKNNYLYTLRA